MAKVMVNAVTDEAYISNADGTMYVHEVRGVCFISWVLEKDKEHAAKFPADRAVEWSRLIADISGQPCEPVFISADLQTLADVVDAKEMKTLLRKALHVLEKGVEIRMMDQWPALQKIVPDTIKEIKKALGIVYV
jgi:hypothetical protein